MKKKIRERDITRAEQSDTSPYWHWVRDHQPRDEEGRIIEPVEANPDELSEEDALWFQPDNKQDYKIRKQKLKRTLDSALLKMTETDREIVTLMSQGFLSNRQLAERMGVSKSFINNRINQIRKNVDKLR